MRMIKISEEVWQAIASQGKFGETEDDVLRRVFELPSGAVHEGGMTSSSGVSSYRYQSGRRQILAQVKMTSYIALNKLHIEFHGGNSSSWTLPDRSDKAGIRVVLEKALVFAKTNGATQGQINAVRKTLTNDSYYLTK